MFYLGHDPARRRQPACRQKSGDEEGRGVHRAHARGETINPRWFDITAASIENKRDQAWLDVTRLSGMRKDESNRLKWTDIDWRTENIRYPETKTEKAKAWLPVAPAAAVNALHDL